MFSRRWGLSAVICCPMSAGVAFAAPVDLDVPSDRLPSEFQLPMLHYVRPMDDQGKELT